jgi:dihydrofolate reductase
MRKLVMWNVISLDGCFEGEKAWDLNFHDLVWGKELEDYGNEQLGAGDILVFGENTYKGMADFWSKAEGTTADKMNAMRKIVCSPTLEKAEWQGSTIIRDAVPEITKLKQEGEGTMIVMGSGILSESLINAKLFDEYRLVIVPVLLGRGRRLFTDTLQYQPLQLIEARTLQTGGILVRYAPAQK